MVSIPLLRLRATFTFSAPEPKTFNPPTPGGSAPPAIRMLRESSSVIPLVMRFISATSRCTEALRFWYWKTARTPELTNIMITKATRISIRVNPRRISVHPKDCCGLQAVCVARLLDRDHHLGQHARGETGGDGIRGHRSMDTHQIFGSALRRIRPGRRQTLQLGHVVIAPQVFHRLFHDRGLPFPGAGLALVRGGILGGLEKDGHDDPEDDQRHHDLDQAESLAFHVSGPMWLGRWRAGVQDGKYP